MPSRKKRKRYRLRAEATEKAHGGWGNGYPVTLSDMLMVRKAIREGWAVPDQVCEAISADIYAAALNDDATLRELLGAARVIIAMEDANYRFQQQALQRLAPR